MFPRLRTAHLNPAEDPSPRVLGARFGVNPNSSSLGVDVTYLLFGGTGAVAIAISLSAWLRARRVLPQLHGDAP